MPPIAAFSASVPEGRESSFLPPQRPFGGAERPAESFGQMLDGLRRVDDLRKLRSDLLDVRAHPNSWSCGSVRHCDGGVLESLRDRIPDLVDLLERGQEVDGP